MKDLLTFRFSWAAFFLLGLALLALYIALRLTRRFLDNSPIARNIRKPVNDLITQLLVLYEPLAIILLAGTFIFINPGFHGALILFILIIGFAHIRNYISGKLLWFSETFQEGKMVETGKIKGIITRKGNLGTYIRTPEGMHYVSYSRIFAEGYTLISDNQTVGEYSLLEVTPMVKPEKGEKSDVFQSFHNQWVNNPFINRNYKPEITYQNGNLVVKAFFREKNHIRDLVRLIGEWGYSCKILEENRTIN
ncbi:MAG: hypothetical protein R3C61_16295 [Bacteroidia bacterium]